MTGEPINDVLFTHSASVEEALNINIELNSTDLDSVNRIVKESTASGDNTYQAFWQHLGNSVNLAFEGNCYPLSDLESFDFEKPWWKQSLNQDISVGENVFLAFGDITLYTYESMTVMTFNKGLLKDFQKEDPYDLVDRNEWTFDAFRIMLEDVKQDVNGNGVYGEELQDIFALGGYPSMSFEAFFINQGMYLVTKDENNIPHFNGMSEEHYDFFMQMSDLISDKERVSYMKNFTMNFAGNKQLFFAGRVFCCGVYSRRSVSHQRRTGTAP